MKKALNIFARSFQKAHYLANLDLDFGFNMKLTPLLMRKLSSLFQTMQNLTKLFIFYFTQNQVTGNLLSLLLTGIQKLRSLSHLCLKFYQAFIDEHQIELLCSGLSKCRSLTHLELDFQLCSNLTNEGIKKLLIAGRNLKLACFELNLYVSSSPIKEPIVYKDLESIMVNFELEDFSISSRYSGVSQNSTFKFSLKDLEIDKLQGFQVRFHQTHDPKLRKENKAQRELILALPNLRHLKSLNLTCLGYYGSDNLSSNLAACILQMKSLERLGLELEMSPSLSSLSGVLKSMNGLKMIPNLKVLELKFRDFNLSDAQIKSLLGSCLSKIRTLMVLELDFGACKVSQTIFEGLALLNLSGNLSELVSLRLALSPSIEKEDGRGFMGLAKGVFSWKRKIQVEKFCASLRSLGDLKSLDMKLKNVYFSSEEQKILSKSIAEMRSLQKLEVESSYDENLEGNMKDFEDILIESQALLNCWLTLSVQFHKTKNERIALTPVVFNFEDSEGVPYCLEISFCHYDDSPWYRHNPGFFKKLLNFFKEISPNFVENNQKSQKSLAQIIRDSNKIAFLDLTGPAYKSLEVLKAFAQKFSIDGLKLAKYSFIINSKRVNTLC